MRVILPLLTLNNSYESRSYELCRLTFRAHFIETGSESMRPAASMSRKKGS
jgi:hypothetical protein